MPSGCRKRGVLVSVCYNYGFSTRVPVSSRGQDTWFSATGPGFESPYRYQKLPNPRVHIPRRVGVGYAPDVTRSPIRAVYDSGPPVTTGNVSSDRPSGKIGRLSVHLGTAGGNISEIRLLRGASS